MSIQLHVLEALSEGNDPKFSLNRKLRGPQNVMDGLGNREESCRPPMKLTKN